ncbi:ATP12 family chaperone protein [Phenylobacterium sp.]|uniref:ATP12 family chaperone protein n=1 Tax=Phenylobacterium sp. TaxID=1871053 RepID=UPI001812AD36|nr:ATP12 family protein [Phenylobacterium sp.]MBA4792411.1 ATPase [Phenylobacterium sp.]
MRRGFQEPVEKPRRFYKTVSVTEAESGFAVLLDQRQVRAPGGRQLVLPTRALADMVAQEWADQGETLEVAEMHATRLANTAIESVPKAREATARSVADYAGSDLLCYFAEEPQALVERQNAHWGPMIDRAEREIALVFARAAGIVHRSQPEETLEKIKALALELDDFRLTGLAYGSALFGSAILALALQRGWIDGRQALELSRLDEAYQEEKWGIDAEAAERTARLLVEAQMLERWFKALDRR